MDGTSEKRVYSELRGQVIGAQTQMQIFNFFFAMQLGVLVLRHADSLSSTLQYTQMLKLSKLQKYVFQHCQL